MRSGIRLLWQFLDGRMVVIMPRRWQWANSFKEAAHVGGEALGAVSWFIVRSDELAQNTVR